MTAMRLVVDAIGVRQGSAAIVISNLLQGWRRAFPHDTITLLTDGPADFHVADGVHAIRVTQGAAGPLARVWAQSIGVRRAAHRARADAVLTAVTTGALLGAGCRWGAIVYDLRHELRPQQFSGRRRAARRVLYGWTFRRADALFCISNRTRNDLLARRPALRGKAVAALLGADHAESWRSSRRHTTYVLAFGHFANKNLDMVLRAWARYCTDHDGAVLRVCGVGKASRPQVETLIAELDCADRIELLGWLTDAEFQSTFAGASCVVFPSDFEGFGLPAVEAMLLGIPVVISRDPALIEVTAGHAVVADGEEPHVLAAAIADATALTPQDLAAAQAHARTLTWSGTASTIRAGLSDQPHIPLEST